MYVKEAVLRVTAILYLATICLTAQEKNSTKKSPTRPLGKYPQKVHTLYQNRYGKRLSQIGVWSAWGAWSECSRTCGGGVMVQTRYCINRASDNRFIQKPRKRRHISPPSRCVGVYKRIHLCNPQECPLGRNDFRSEQCSTFNGRKFKGNLYFWEPFLQGAEECALNCRPRGMNFYATLKKSVIDGTPCFRPFTFTGKPAPTGTKGICISGTCKSVDSRGVIGSIDENQSECPACSTGLCKSINGIYTRSNLPSGYSLIADVPKGACRILVQQMKHSRNFIALKKTNGSFIINGDGKFSSSSRTFEGAGTKFSYVKQDSKSLETITSQGPLEESVEIFLVTYQPNLGVKYGYLLPNDVERQIAPPTIRFSNHVHHPFDGRQIASPSYSIPNTDLNIIETRKIDRNLHSNQQDDPKSISSQHHTRQRRVRRRFSWKISGISACSKSCGGGIQTTVVSCVRELTQTPVPDKRCIHLDKPNANPIRCNIQDCPPRWSGYWSSCSVTCGTGIQRYLSQCKQELNTGREIIVDDIRCSGRPKPLVKTQTCSEIACDISNNEVPRTQPDFKSSRPEGQWLVGEWSPCSTTCGVGHRTRTTSCPEGDCRPESRPAHAEYCSLPSCNTKVPKLESRSLTQSTEITPWLFTEWSKCSEECGTGKQTRYTVCGRGTCDISSKPESSRDCSSDRQCGGQWFAGPWGECSDSCSGQASQKREIICVVTIRGLLRITNEQTCPNHLKPPNIQPCSGKCDPFWFVGDWRNCENCPNGIQRREIRCMDVTGIPSNRCLETNMPSIQRPCNCQKREEREKYRPAQDQPIDQSCIDRIRNCYLAVQARLCQYPYYNSQCCAACRKAEQDHVVH